MKRFAPLPLRIRFVGLIGLTVLASCLGTSSLANGASVDRAVLDAEARRIEVIDRAAQTVLAIFGPDSGDKKISGGSGVVISPDGFALTNFHVVHPIGPWMKCGMADGKLYDAVLVGLDPTGDVALIKLLGRDDFPTAEPADSDKARVGDPVFAMGNPFLLATDFQPTTSHGILSGTHRYQFPTGSILEYTDCLQTDAAINPGNSGGPLFDADGKLLGINGRCSFEKRGRVSVGVGYAISINQIGHFQGVLRSGRIVDHATLGARVAFDANGQVVVDDILDTSDAYRQGLRYGDEIVRFAGRPIDSPGAMKNILGIFPKGWRVPLVYRRDGNRQTIFVRLAGLHHEGQLEQKIKDKPPEPPIPKSPIPAPEQPEGKKKEKRKSAKELEFTQEKEPIPMPSIVGAHYEKKDRFANYHYNRLGRQRVWSSWHESLGAAGSLSGTWHLTGHTDGGQPFSWTIDRGGVTAKLPGGQLTLDAGSPSGENLDPPHSGGLLSALFFWNRIESQIDQAFAEMTYWGSLPASAWSAEYKDNQTAENGPLEILLGRRDGVEIQFIFNAKNGRLVGIDLFPHADAAPCEIRFSGFKTVNGKTVPCRWEVRHNGQRYGVFHVEQWQIEPKPTTSQDHETKLQ